MAFALRFQRASASGVCVAVALPDSPGPVLPPELHRDEAAYAQLMAPPRRAGFVGGRLALRAALTAVGARDVGPILATPRGAPTLPAGFVGSISHKREVAVAIAAPADDPPRTTVGIDVEIPRVFRYDISDRVLTADERAVLGGLDESARASELLFRFAAKEAIYKALDPWVRRFVSFHEAEIATTPDGGRAATLTLARGEGPFSISLRDASADGLVIAEAWISRAV